MFMQGTENGHLATIVEECRQLLVERQRNICRAYHWLRRCPAFMTVVLHFQRSGFTLFQVAAVLAYSDLHPLGSEALERLWEALTADEVDRSHHVLFGRINGGCHELERNRTMLEPVGGFVPNALAQTHDGTSRHDSGQARGTR